jgi:AcrR family transcriptional regulator
VARKPADQSVNRDEIIAAAADVLQRKGYDAATMKDIAAAVNLTAASLYHHFKNKDALFLAVLEAGLTFVLDQLEPIAESNARADDKLRKMIACHIIGVTNNSAVGAAMVFEIRALLTLPIGLNGNGERDEQILAARDAFFKQRDRFENLFHQVVREGIEHGVFRSVDPGVFVKMILGAQNWVGVWFKPDGRLSGEEIAERMADILIKGVCLSVVE